MIGIKQKNQVLSFQTEQTVNRKISGFRTARKNMLQRMNVSIKSNARVEIEE